MSTVRDSDYAVKHPARRAHYCAAAVAEAEAEEGSHCEFQLVNSHGLVKGLRWHSQIADSLL